MRACITALLLLCSGSCSLDTVSQRAAEGTAPESPRKREARRFDAPRLWLERRPRAEQMDSGARLDAGPTATSADTDSRRNDASRPPEGGVVVAAEGDAAQAHARNPSTQDAVGLEDGSSTDTEATAADASQVPDDAATSPPHESTDADVAQDAGADSGSIATEREEEPQPEDTSGDEDERGERRRRGDGERNWDDDSDRDGRADEGDRSRGARRDRDRDDGDRDRDWDGDSERRRRSGAG